MYGKWKVLASAMRALGVAQRTLLAITARIRAIAARLALVSHMSNTVFESISRKVEQPKGRKTKVRCGQFLIGSELSSCSVTRCIPEGRLKKAYHCNSPVRSNSKR